VSAEQAVKQIGPNAVGTMASGQPADVLVHPQALVETRRIGRASRIGAFAHLLPGAVIGRDANIGDHVVIGNDVLLGDRVTLACGAQVWDGARIEDDVFIGPNATLAGEHFPGGKPRPVRETRIRQGASIGANASVLPGLTIGPGARIGAGTVVTRDVPSNAVVTGNPARIAGYVDVLEVSQHAVRPAGAEKELPKLRARGARLHHLPLIVDLRGALTFGEIGKHLPFTPKRFFIIYDVPNMEVRGEHAHKELHEFLVCVKGSCSIMLDDGEYRDEVMLDTPSVGLHVPPKLWRVHYKYSADALTLVLASDIYNADDYIRDYQQFKEYVSTR
jgi:acetyltransferase-like isoleucine patch superfamily enzyme